MKWLFVTLEFPWPLDHGTWLRVYHLARALRRTGDEVSLLSCAGSPEGIDHYRQLGIDVLDGPKEPGPRRGRSRNFLGPYVFHPPLAKSLDRCASRFHAVVLVRPILLQYAREAARGGCVIADVVDDPFLEERREFRREYDPRRWLRRVRFLAGEYYYERKYLDRVDVTTLVSDHDTNGFQTRHPGRKVATISNGVDTAYFHPPNKPDHGPNGRPRVTFLGNLLHPPNEDAAIYLVRQIAPLIWSRVPETEVVILGSNPSPGVRELSGPRVTVTGWVPDVRPMLWSSTVTLLPMRAGTGIKNKLLESWAAGTPVVTTRLACQGVPARDGTNLLLGDTADELADRAVALIRDRHLGIRLASNGRRTVEESMTWDQAAENLRQHVRKN